MKNNYLKVLRILFGVILLTSVTLYAGSAGAVLYSGTYVDMYLKQNTFPSNLDEQKIYLDAATASTITGHVGSQDGTILVTFSSTTDTLLAADGFATIKADDGYINQLSIKVSGYYFDDLIFSINLAPNTNNDLVITAFDKSGGYDTYGGWTGAKDWVNGENDILLLSKSGNLMQSVTIRSGTGLSAFGVDQLKQTQVSGLTPVPTPEPATLLYLGVGLMGLAGVRRKFQSK